MRRVLLLIVRLLRVHDLLVRLLLRRQGRLPLLVRPVLLLGLPRGLVRVVLLLGGRRALLLRVSTSVVLHLLLHERGLSLGLRRRGVALLRRLLLLLLLPLVRLVVGHDQDVQRCTREGEEEELQRNDSTAR